MIKINSPNNTSSLDDTLVYTSTGNNDTLYCYDTMNSNSISVNSLNYPTTSMHPTGNNVYITNNTGGTISPNWNINDTLTVGHIKHCPLTVHGDAEIEGKLKLGGKDVGRILEKLEERLAILHPNVELEDRWEELKELSRRYKELEQDILEKEKIYNILKK